MKDIERKIGETFYFNGIQLIVKKSEGFSCKKCCFHKNTHTHINIDNIIDNLGCYLTDEFYDCIGPCMRSERSDKTYVHFEKVVPQK